MKQVLLGLLAAGLLGAALVWSAGPVARPEFDFKTEATDPVTPRKPASDPNDFQFAIVSDRTGGHRARVFARAVDQLNLLQPEFVVTVGDLIEGYSRDRKRIDGDWREFQGHLSRLQMPFFYAPGNHDIANDVMDDVWREKFGRRYYEFLYRDVLFVVLNSEDPPGKEAGNISRTQQLWLEKTLAAHKSARWTFVIVHKPMWLLDEGADGNWGNVEKLLAGRKYTVFAGHVHRYQKFVRRGMNYYMLATTGGVSRMRGVEYGEFDHLVWVTMKKDGPVLANVLLDGVLREDLAPIVNDEDASPRLLRRPTVPVEAVVTLDGKPVGGAEVMFSWAGEEKPKPWADGLTDAAGRATLSTYEPNDGAPPGAYAVAVTLRRPRFTPEGKPGPNLLPARYARFETSGMRAEITAKGKQTLEITLMGDKP